MSAASWGLGQPGESVSSSVDRWVELNPLEVRSNSTDVSLINNRGAEENVLATSILLLGLGWKPVHEPKKREKCVWVGLQCPENSGTSDVGSGFTENFFFQTSSLSLLWLL